jgi:small subunit ribosomal protein S20
MPNTKSAIKRMRQNEQRRMRNRRLRSRMRTQIKNFQRLVEQGEVEEARQILPSVYSVVDNTAGKGVIHRNTAGRYKSRLAKLLN